MPTIHFELQSTLAPEAVLAALTDFGPTRAEVWPNIDSDHFQVHDQGPGWAEVTEEARWPAASGSGRDTAGTPPRAPSPSRRSTPPL